MSTGDVMPQNLSSRSIERLSKTPEGNMLLGAILLHKGPTKLAAFLNVSPMAVRQWVYSGRMSIRGAEAMAELTKRDKREFRPDLSDEEWGREPPGPVPGSPPEAKTADAKLLVKLAAQYGSVEALCAAAYITVANYHTWKSRGRIPAIKLPTLMALQK